MNTATGLVTLTEVELAAVTGGDYLDDLDDSWVNGDIDSPEQYWLAHDLEMERRTEAGYYP